MNSALLFELFFESCSEASEQIYTLLLKLYIPDKENGGGMALPSYVVCVNLTLVQSND